MRIVYLSSVRIPNEKASGLAIVRQCEAFTKLGHFVTLVRPDRNNWIKDDVFSYYGIKPIFNIITIPLIQLYLKFGMFGYILMRSTLICSLTWHIYAQRKDIDVLYARDPWILFLPLFFIAKEKIVFEAHSKHTNFVTKYVVKNVGLCVVISEGLRAFYAPLRRKTDIVVEPSGVDVDQFLNLPSVADTRKKFLLPTEKSIIGYVGKYTTMGEEKGVDELIDAFAALYQKKSNVHLLMVGFEEVEFALVQEKCRKLSLPEDAYTLRTLDPKEFAEYLHLCDVLVMNYPDTEHYRLYMSPTKLFAYMAADKVIVTSNLPSVRSIVSEQEVIFSIPNDKTSLTLALEKGLDIVKTGQKTNLRARAKQFSWLNRGERIIATIEKTYE